MDPLVSVSRMLELINQVTKLKLKRHTCEYPIVYNLFLTVRTKLSKAATIDGSAIRSVD